MADIRTVVRDRVREHVDHSLVRPGRYLCVAHLIDLDGAYVPEDHVLLDTALSHISYGADHIATPNRDRTLRVMEEKRRQISLLLREDAAMSLGHGMAVPYRLFFVSRNLEHALNGSMGTLTQSEKDDQAAVNAMVFHRNPKRLFDELTYLYATQRPAGVIRPTWRQTWDHVAEETRSLERGSNLILLPRFVMEASEQNT